MNIVKKLKEIKSKGPKFYWQLLKDNKGHEHDIQLHLHEILHNFKIISETNGDDVDNLLHDIHDVTVPELSVTLNGSITEGGKEKYQQT